MSAIHAALSLPLLAAACAVLAVVGIRESGPARAQSLGDNPPLARLEIDLWPEFDRESSVLVILRAEVAAEATLPAEVSVRIPASSGGPTAVAEAAAPDSQLLNVPYGRTDVQIDFMTITFEITERFFHLEFYNPIATGTPDRAYEYLWPGDFSVGALAVQVQEPATSTGVTVAPDLGAPVARADGLNYREADLGALETGQPLAVEIQYTKPDSRTTADIVGFEQSPAPAESDDDGSTWTSAEVLIPAAIIAAVVMVGAGAYLARKQLAAATAPASRGQRRRAVARGQFCRRCSAPLEPGDKFCAACGHPVKGRG